MSLPSPTPLRVGLRGIGLLAPGINDWSAGQAILRGQTPYVAARTVLPASPLLPPAERRRAVPVVKLALAVAEQACAMSGFDRAELASVFTASDGDGGNCHQICETLASDDRAISPTRFHNSVHNAAAGYWGIAAAATPTSNAMCAADGSFAAGLLEAAVQVVAENRPVLLVAYDTDFPEPLRAKRPIPDCGGVALVLVPAGTAGAGVELGLGLAPADAPPTRLADPTLDALRTAIPALRALSLLDAVARQRPGVLRIDYLPDLVLRLDLAPA